MARLQPPLEQTDGWNTINAPELHKWDRPGEIVSGVLTSYGTIKIDGKPVVRFVLTDGSAQIACLAPWDITQKLSAAHVGCKVRVKYRGEDENIRGGPDSTPMKVFDVQIKGTPTPGASTPEDSWS